MAEIWAASLVTIGVGAYTANQQKKSAQGATNATIQGQQDAIAEERRQFDINNANQQPYLQAGASALSAQQQFLNGDTSGFDNSADYIFRRDQALQSQERGASARGGFMGGGADADRIALASGIAGQAANDYWSKLAGRAGQGYTAAQNIGAAGQAMAGNIGNAYGNMANARASSYGANADANSQLAAGVGNAFGNWYGANQANNPGGTGWYVGNNPGKG